jgi:hypothetical protein
LLPFLFMASAMFISGSSVHKILVYYPIFLLLHLLSTIQWYSMAATSLCFNISFLNSSLEISNTANLSHTTLNYI